MKKFFLKTKELNSSLIKKLKKKKNRDGIQNHNL